MRSPPILETRWLPVSSDEGSGSPLVPYIELLRAHLGSWRGLLVSIAVVVNSGLALINRILSGFTRVK